MLKQREGETRYSLTNTNNYEGGTFESLCASSDITPRHHSYKTIALDHHLYYHLSNTWIRRHSKPQPFINLFIKLLPEDHKALDFSLKVAPSYGRLKMSALPSWNSSFP